MEDYCVLGLSPFGQHQLLRPATLHVNASINFTFNGILYDFLFPFECQCQFVAIANIVWLWLLWDSPLLGMVCWYVHKLIHISLRLSSNNIRSPIAFDLKWLRKFSYGNHFHWDLCLEICLPFRISIICMYMVVTFLISAVCLLLIWRWRSPVLPSPLIDNTPMGCLNIIFHSSTEDDIFENLCMFRIKIENAKMQKLWRIPLWWEINECRITCEIKFSSARVSAYLVDSCCL